MMLFGQTIGKTTILHRADVINALFQIFSNTERTINICGNSKFPLKIFSYDLINKLLTGSSFKQRGIKQRYIFEITKENVFRCKDIMKIDNLELRYMDDIEANFVVNEREYLGSINLQEPNHQQAIYSNISDVVEQQHSIFETIWNKSIPAEDVIKQIEEGVEPEFFEVISDSQKATEIYVNLAKSLDKEGLLLFADSKALLRAERLGVVDYLIKAAQSGVTIKIICPLTEDNSEIVKRISQKAPDIRILNGGSSHSGLFVADKMQILKFELKEPKAAEFSQAIGFIIYSNSKASVSSSMSLFELIWNEHIQYEKIKEYERQKEADKIKDEFINIAAHELRTPIQPILGLSQLLYSGKVNDAAEHDRFLDTIIRNARRLQRLADSLLDVTKIQSQSLKLNKERIKINDVIIEAIEDHKDQIEKSKNSVKLVSATTNDSSNKKEDTIVEADRERLTQVISNLLSNAIKFSNSSTGGVINIDVKGKKVEDNKEVVVVSVKDTGTGIDAEVFPRLFSRFVSKPLSGTGLGLFIAKSIIEAHDGRIWAENNPDGKGATFSFSIPTNNTRQYNDVK
jgi:two-component system, OmpR family, sensor histidine kinase VicK